MIAFPIGPSIQLLSVPSHVSSVALLTREYHGLPQPDHLQNSPQGQEQEDPQSNLLNVILI